MQIDYKLLPSFDFDMSSEQGSLIARMNKAGPRGGEAANAQKIIFRAVCALTSANLLGSSVENQTCFTFIRIGDT